MVNPIFPKFSLGKQMLWDPHPDWLAGQAFLQ
jgi:hypothetical protein